MPNIELHNFLRGNALISKTKDDIWKTLESYPDIDEIVVTEVPSSSEQKNRKSAPEYLRVWAGSEEELKDVIARLKPLGFDIEPALLGGKFIPGEFDQKRAQELLKTLRPTSGTDPTFDYEKGQLKEDSRSDVQARVDNCAENLKRDLGPYPVTQSKLLD